MGNLKSAIFFPDLSTFLGVERPIRTFSLVLGILWTTKTPKDFFFAFVNLMDYKCVGLCLEIEIVQ